MSSLPKITGPWANWDDTLEGQKVYFSVEEYPDSKKATEELRRLLEEVDAGVVPEAPDDIFLSWAAMLENPERLAAQFLGGSIRLRRSSCPMLFKR